MFPRGEGGLSSGNEQASLWLLDHAAEWEKFSVLTFDLTFSSQHASEKPFTVRNRDVHPNGCWRGFLQQPLAS